MTKKRDLFNELVEGFDALAEQRVGKRTLTSVYRYGIPGINSARAHDNRSWRLWSQAKCPRLVRVKSV